jgi:hypothetical protein
MLMFNKIKGFVSSLSSLGEVEDVISITKDISIFWEKTDNFRLAHSEYFKHINKVYDLKFKNEEIVEISDTIVSLFILKGYSQSNTMYIFAQFIYYHIFGGNKPNNVRHDTNTIFRELNFIEHQIVPPVAFQFKNYKGILDNKSFTPLNH